MKIKEIYTKFRIGLKDVYDKNEIDSICTLCITEVLNCSRQAVLSEKEKNIPKKEEEKLLIILDRLIRNEPVQYILGKAYFYDFKFYVTKDVLIPRSETEELIEIALKEAGNKYLDILDIGTGSGCIPISLKKENKNLNLTATDVSKDSIRIAKKNAKLNNVNINFIIDDIFNTSIKDSRKFDIIISNPPYVLESDKKMMHNNILDYEPDNALFVSDDNPLIYYNAIVEFSKIRLNKKGVLLVEIHENFGDEMINLLESAGFRNIVILKDLRNKNRFAKAVK